MAERHISIALMSDVDVERVDDKKGHQHFGR